MDLIERLESSGGVGYDAAKEIARMEKRIAELEAALLKIQKQATFAKYDHEYAEVLAYCGTLAREALSKE